jgi:PAS domain S-box-containing protein
MDRSDIAGSPRQGIPAVESSSDAVVALFLRQALRALTVIIILGLAVLVPFFAVNKKGAAIGFLTVAGLMLLPSALLLWAGRVTKAVWTFLTSGMVTMTLLVAVSGGSHGTALQLAIAVIAMVLLNRNAGLIFAMVALLADLGIALFPLTGGHLPLLFPFPPIATWFSLALMFLLVLPTVDQAMSQLRESEERFEKAFRSNPEGITLTTHDGCFLEVNDAFLQMMEYSRPQLIGNTALQLGIWASEQERSSLIMKLTGQEPVRGHDAELKTRTGRSRHVQISAERVRLQETDCILAITRDVTQQQLLEQRLRRMEKMEALGRLAGGVVHVFNNLLMIISGSAEMLQPSVKGIAPNEYLSRIRTTTDKAAALTKQLLAFTRQQVLRPDILNLNAVVGDLWDIMPRLLRSDVETVLLLQAGLGTVSADCGQIEQVIMNLAANARDAMPRGGKLTIRTADVELDPQFILQHGVKASPGPYVMLAMTDTGIGMSAEVQAQIFEPFFTTKELRRGTGLGLATAYGIVDQSGGFIVVESEADKGSTFSVYLPRTGSVARCMP